MNNSLEDFYKYLKHLFNFIREPLFHMKGSDVTVSSILISIVTVVLSIRIARIVGSFVNRKLSQRAVDPAVGNSIEKFVRYFLVGMGILFSLDNLGVSISSLTALGAVLMVGIGFGLQNIAQNFISGIIILIERPIKIGDIVKVGSASGQIVDIRVRSTLIQTRDEITIIVPNSKLVSEEVINERFLTKKIRQHIRIGVGYGSDVEMVKQTLCEAALKQNDVLKTPPPVAIFEDFGESSLSFDLRFWTTNIWFIDQVSSDIRTEIDVLCRQRKIEIPFPQRDIHIRTQVPEKTNH